MFLDRNKCSGHAHVVSLAYPKTIQLYSNQHQELGRRPYQPARRARWVARADVVSLHGTTKRHSVDPPTMEGFLFSESTLAPGLVQAYRETEYRVFGTELFRLSVGSASPELLALYQGHKVTCAAFITACNPLSQELPAHENQRRQDELAKELSQRSLNYLDGFGQHPSGRWPGEPSFLVLGLELEAAKSLGQSLEQNAIVWCGANAVPELILLR
jgi:hypothetical protein